MSVGVDAVPAYSQFVRSAPFVRSRLRPANLVTPAMSSLATFFIAFFLLGAPAAAQQVDDTGTLPNARPGECYAKVITPAKFATRSEEIIVQDASTRIEASPAVFEKGEEKVIVKEASSIIEAVPATFEKLTEQVQTRGRELQWMTGGKQGQGKGARPADPAAVVGIADSGVNVDAVEPGSCFSEYYTAAEYRTELERVLTKEGSSRIEVDPAVYETVEERVVVKEASSEIVDVPAVFRTETESVLVEPAREVWKPGRGPVERIDDATGEILCLVEIPARYETVRRTVLDKPATSKTVNIPAEYETVQVQRLVKPASERRIAVEPEYTTVETMRKVEGATFFWASADAGPGKDSGAIATGREVCRVERPAEFQSVPRQIVAEDASTRVTEVPAEYRTLVVQRLASPASQQSFGVPARSETVTRQVEISPSRLEWRPVLCETNMTREIVSSIQQALAREGFDPGPADGMVGRGTMQAIEAYQTKNSLDRGGITYETLKSLDVKAP